jgi:hypothetical protein
MKRWYIFFVLVGILVAMGGLGVFSGSLEQQTHGPAGAGKILFLTMLGIGGAAFAAWLAFSSSARKRRMDAVKDAHERHPESSAHGPEWQPPPQRPVDESGAGRSER